MTITGKIRAVSSLRRAYVNWPQIVLLYAMRRRPSIVKLRHGPKVRLRDTGKTGRFCSLAALRDAGWNVETLDANRMVLVHKSGIKMICDYATSEDLGALVEIFVAHAYGAEYKNKIVLDVGAGNGDSTSTSSA